jgi:chromosome segregation ATPase
LPDDAIVVGRPRVEAPVTNEGYESMAQGFAEHRTLVLDQFAVLRLELERRFGGIDRRSDGVDQRLDGLEQRLDGLEQRLDRVEQRLDRLEGKLDAFIEAQSAVNIQILSKLDAIMSSPPPPPQSPP